jgi:hypothetical protein
MVSLFLKSRLREPALTSDSVQERPEGARKDPSWKEKGSELSAALTLIFQKPLLPDLAPCPSQLD